MIDAVAGEQHHRLFRAQAAVQEGRRNGVTHLPCLGIGDGPPAAARFALRQEYRVRAGLGPTPHQLAQLGLKGP